MSVTATTSATFVAPKQEVSRPNRITFDLDTLPEEYAGLKPHHIIIGEWLRDNTKTPVDVQKLMEQAEIETIQLTGTPPLAFTFRFAVQYMVDLINEYAELPRRRTGDMQIPIPHPGTIQYDIYQALSNYETPRSDRLSAPPEYGRGICSASPRDLRFLEGTIIHMLYETGHLSSYGRKGVEFWVNL